MDDVTLDDSLKALLQQVPRPVRDYILNDLSGKVRELMTRYNLHVDQGGVLQGELMIMMLGQQEPAEFMQELKNAGIPDAAVQSLMHDINEEIFKPIRAAERGGSAAPTPSPEPVEAVAPAIPEPAAPQAPPAPEPVAPAPVVPQAPHMHTMAADQAAIMAQAAQPMNPQQYGWTPYQAPMTYMPPPPPQAYWVPVTVAPMPVPNLYQQPYYQYAQPQVVPAPAPQAPMQPPAPAPNPVPEPEDRPAYVPPPSMPHTPPPAPTPPPSVAPASQPPRSFDPYREPV